MVITFRRVVFTTALLLTANAAALAGPREEARLLEATQVLEDTADMPDQAVPDWLLRRAQGIAVMPTVLKVGLGIGGRGGKGVLMVRDAQGRWSNPVFITLAGGSFGWQAGVEASDIILVFTTRKSIEGITGGKVTLGADASVAVGPVGRQVSGATDFGLNAEVYSYSRSKGLFGGLAIDGTVITIDHRANASYYQRSGVLASEIFDGSAPAAPPSARRLLDTLRRMPHGGDGEAPAAVSSTATASPAEVPEPEPRGLESGGATVYPMQPPPPH